MRGTSIAKNYALGWIRQGLKDWNISRNLDWGIPYPGDEELKLYVWAENYAGYISFTEEWSRQTGRDWEEYWKGKGKIIHFIGADIVYHHAVFWPAILKGANYGEPWAIVASGMVKVEGHVFSKSRGFVTYVEEDYIQNGFDLDVVRYYILSYTGHTKDLDVSWKDLQIKTNNELVGILGNFAYRILLFIHKNYKKIPEGKITSETKKKIQQTIDTIQKAIADYRFKEAVDSVMHLAAYGNTIFQQSEPWKYSKTDPTRCQNDLYQCLQLLKAISILIEPVTPTVAERVWEQLGLEGDIHLSNVEECLKPLSPGSALPKPKVLFTKIADEITQKMTATLNKRIENAVAKAK